MRSRSALAHLKRCFMNASTILSIAWPLRVHILMGARAEEKAAADAANKDRGESSCLNIQMNRVQTIVQLGVEPVRSDGRQQSDRGEGQNLGIRVSRLADPPQ